MWWLPVVLAVVALGLLMVYAGKNRGVGVSKCERCGKGLGRIGMRHAGVCHHCGHRQGSTSSDA